MWFLLNVDFVDVFIVFKGFDLEIIFVVVVLKMFIIVEIMLNVCMCRVWIMLKFGVDVVFKYMVVVSINLKLVEEFGIDFKNVFVFWDWVGGWYSVMSVVGVLFFFL